MLIPTAQLAALRQILSCLPAVQYAAAYGSGVIAQPGLYAVDHPASAAGAAPAPTKGPMLDFILAVDDPVAWHAQNIKSNPEHYSWVSSLGAQVVAGIAKYVGVGVHFNPLVHINGQLVKYGVVSCEDLLDDLTTWRHLYLAGRLQKPVATLTSHASIQPACQYNISRAALTALLLLPHRFSTQEFLHRVVGLSYLGDVRMGLAEDPHKVERIVAGSYQALEAMYLPLLAPPAPAAPADTPHLKQPQAQPQTSPPPHHANGPGHSASQEGISSAAGHAAHPAAGSVDSVSAALPAALTGVQQVQPGVWEQRVDAASRTQLLAHLPPALMAQVGQQVGYAVPESHCEAGCSTALELAHAVVSTHKYQQMVSRALHRTVRASSLWQAASGAVSAGGGRVAAYVVAKIQKAWKAGKPRLAELKAHVDKTRHPHR